MLISTTASQHSLSTHGLITAMYKEEIPTEEVRLLLIKGYYAIIKGPNLDAITFLGETVLHRAIRQRNIEIIKLLLDHKANLNIRDKWGFPPLHAALEFHSSVSKKTTSLLSRYSEASHVWDTLDSQMTRIISLLLDYGADINLRDNFGDTALHEAAAKGLAEASKLLLDRGAEINAQNSITGVTPLHLAINSNAIPLVTFLIKRGADISIRDKIGCQDHRLTAVQYVERRAGRCERTFSILPAKDNYVQTLYDLFKLEEQKSGEKQVANYAEGGHFPTLTECLPPSATERFDKESIVEVKVPTVAPNPHLIRAILDLDGKTVQELLKEGEDPNLPDELGGLPLVYAIYMQAVDILHMLLEKGADPHLQALRSKPVGSETTRQKTPSPYKVASQFPCLGIVGIFERYEKFVLPQEKRTHDIAFLLNEPASEDESVCSKKSRLAP